MSIKFNGKTVAGNYKIQLSTEATTVQKGLIRIATDEEAQLGKLEDVAITPKQLSEYGGGGSGSGGSTNTLVDDITIVKDDDTDIITAVGIKTKNGEYLFDWVGTEEEYNTAIADGTIPENENWVCWITDDGTDADDIIKNKADVNLSNLSEEGKAIVDSKASVDLDNLTTNGEKHFLNKSQITNCLLEVPQRIKYDLTDGTLTIKAGSVVIVPYGTEDKTSEFPVGATFIHENFKVYDTQYTEDAEGNGKFFVWAELQSDTTQDGGTNAGTSKRIVSMALTDNTTVYNVKHYSTNSPSYTESVQYYNTATNYVVHTDGSGGDNARILSFPIIYIQADGTYVYGNVLDVFNGIGYIGNVFWVDKGVKGLAPNEKNDKDGSFINIEWEYTSLYLRDLSFSGNNVYKFGLNGSSSSGISAYSYDEAKNINLNGTSRWNYTYAFDLTKSDGVITSFKAKQPFRAVDYNDIDGKWVTKATVFLNLVTLSNSETTVVSLSSYLPNDGNIYEVMFSMEGSCGTAQFRFDTGYGSVYALYAKSIFGGAFNMVVSPERTLNIYRTSICSGTNKMVLRATAYRKVR